MASPTSICTTSTSLGDVEAVVRRWVEQTDPTLLTGTQAAGDVERLATIIRQLTAKQTGLAARAAECNSYSRRCPSPEDWLARQNGTTRSEAKRAIDTARRLKDCPRTAEAFHRGDLSLGEAEAISGAAVLDPAAEDRLVTKASTSHDLIDTREQVERVKRAARNGEDPAARRARLRARRRWCEFDDDEMKAVAARFVPEELALVTPIIDAYSNAQFDRARAEGRHEPPEAYRADGVLAALAAAGEAIGLTVARSAQPRPAERLPEATVAVERAVDAAGRADRGQIELAELLSVQPDRVKWNVCVLVDAIALKRGYTTATETCEILGFGPVDVDWVSRILPESMVDVLVHDLTDIKAHATLTRHRKKALDAALRARDERCVVPGCRRRQRLQADHRHDFAKHGPTAYDNMERLCEVHHREKTHHGARIERVGDEWHWYPPPPRPSEPAPPPGSIPWRAPVGQHLTAFDLTDLPDPPGGEDQREDGTLPFGSAA